MIYFYPIGFYLYLRFKNVRKVLAELSHKIFYSKLNNLIAVTGTNGKSSICNFYFQILNISIFFLELLQKENQKLPHDVI